MCARNASGGPLKKPWSSNASSWKRSRASDQSCRSTARAKRLSWSSIAVRASSSSRNVANTLGVFDLQLFQLADFRAVVHREAVAEVEQVLVLETGVVLDLPPVVVEVLQVEGVHAVLVHHGKHLADLVLVLVRGRGLVDPVDLLLGADVQAPVVEDVLRMHRRAHLDGDDVELESAAHHHRRLGVAHALEAEELLVELARFLEAVTLHRAMRHHVGLDYRLLVLRVGDAVLDLLSCQRHDSSYGVKAFSASVMNESA